MSDSNNDTLKHLLNTETAKIRWTELQRFFASGTAIFVENTLDLVEISQHIAANNAPAIEALMNTQQIHKVTDQQAIHWFENNTELWAVVVKPWVLVQTVDTTN